MNDDELTSALGALADDASARSALPGPQRARSRAARRRAAKIAGGTLAVCLVAGGAYGLTGPLRDRQPEQVPGTATSTALPVPSRTTSTPAPTSASGTTTRASEGPVVPAAAAQFAALECRITSWALDTGGQLGRYDWLATSGGGDWRLQDRIGALPYTPRLMSVTGVEGDAGRNSWGAFAVDDAGRLHYTSFGVTRTLDKRGVVVDGSVGAPTGVRDTVLAEGWSDVRGILAMLDLRFERTGTLFLVRADGSLVRYQFAEDTRTLSRREQVGSGLAGLTAWSPFTYLPESTAEGERLRVFAVLDGSLRTLELPLSSAQRLRVSGPGSPGLAGVSVIDSYGCDNVGGAPSPAGGVVAYRPSEAGQVFFGEETMRLGEATLSYVGRAPSAALRRL